MAIDNALIIFLSMVMCRAEAEKTYTLSASFALVEMLPRRQFRKFLEMLRTQRIGNGVLFTKPFSQVNQLATARAERPARTREPVPHPLARRTFDIHRHQK